MVDPKFLFIWLFYTVRLQIKPGQTTSKTTSNQSPSQLSFVENAILELPLSLITTILDFVVLQHVPMSYC